MTSNTTTSGLEGVVVADTAISEVDERLSAAHPDPALLLDRALALALLGDASAASRDLAVARKAGAEDSATWRLATILAAAKSGGRPR